MNQPVEYQALTPEATLALPLQGIKLIEASAGTGKTYTIGNLYLRYILEGRRVSELLVVTFTNAATEELRGRIRARLYGAMQQFMRGCSGDDPFLNLLLEDSGDEDKRQASINRLRLAVRCMDEASIYTIHGFCQRALTDHAFNSNQPFDIQLTSDDSDLWEAALKDWWRRSAYTLPDHDVVLFSQSLGSVDDFMQLQQPLRYSHGDILIPEVNAGSKELFNRWHALRTDLKELARDWGLRSSELGAILQHAKALGRGQKSSYYKNRIADKINVLNQWFSSDELLRVPEEFNILCTAELEKHSKPSLRGKDPQLKDRFFSACQRVLDSMQALQQDFRVAALREATAWCRQRVEQAKHENRSMAFHDQLTRLHAALQDPQRQQALADALRNRFPVAMIDEFQDTDAIQYGIFRALYHDHPETTLVMIGDPKQAIYSFRGGDIFTYMRARKDAGNCRYTLDVNWRSVPPLVGAINTIFGSRQDAFVYGDAIDYLPVRTASEEQRGKPHTLLLESSEAVPPLTLWRIPLNDKGKPPGKTAVTADLASSSAAEIARLIRGGADGSIRLGDKALKPGDIAVLVRTGFEGADVRKALQTHGIQAITVGRECVYESEEASGLLSLLHAIIRCNDREPARAALASSLLETDYAEIVGILTDEHRWLEWVDRLRELNRLWLKKGFMTMFQTMLNQLDIGQRMASRELAERRLTNLLHLAELLQQASRAHPGTDALLGWYRQQLHETKNEEAELRLESDDELVKIVTIHASKGLEYPVVFVPFLWGCRAPKHGKTLLAFHDAGHKPWLDAAATADSPHLKLAEKERLAEDVRLAYVALTRARAKIYLAWGKVTARNACDSGTTALAWLLHPVQTPADLAVSLPNSFRHQVDIDADLADLAQRSDHCIEIQPLPATTAGMTEAPNSPATAELTPAVFSGRIATDWRITSFSGLTRDIHQTAHGGSPRSGKDPVLDFPAGSHVGLFLHLLLEQLDFQGDIERQSSELTNELAARFNLDADQVRDTVVQWVRNMVDTPMNPQGLCLHGLSGEQRLNELEFDLSVHSVDIDALNQVLDSAAGQSLENIAVEQFRGMVNGIIDLVFEYQGKFYIADYKSNFLGGSLDDYLPDRLRQAVFDRRYDLQYLLYTLAVHRYLRQRLDNYRYSEHFGGVYYLFLRGMRPEHGPACGVFHDRPGEQLIEQLDSELFGTEGLEASA